MKRWLYVLAYDTAGKYDDQVMLAFWSVFLGARTADDAYDEGGQLAQEQVPNHVRRGLNDYVVEIPR